MMRTSVTFMKGNLQETEILATCSSVIEAFMCLYMQKGYILARMLSEL
jgi:hypothetical protein